MTEARSLWQCEFPLSFSVPDGIMRLVRQGYLEETSYRHDVCPSFGKEAMDGSYLKLWVGHPDPEHESRVEGCETRFAIEVRPKGSWEDEAAAEPFWAGEDEAEAEQRIMEALRAHGGPRRRLYLAQG